MDISDISLFGFGAICCAIACGLIRDHVLAPRCYYYLLAPGVIGVVLLAIVIYQFTIAMSCLICSCINLL